MIHQQLGGSFAQVGALLQYWEEVSFPAVLRVMRTNGVKEDQLGLNEFEQDVWVHASFLGEHVFILDVLDFEETMFQCLLVFEFIVGFSSMLDSEIDLVVKDSIPSIIFRLFRKVKSFGRNELLDLILEPLFEDKESENC